MGDDMGSILELEHLIDCKAITTFLKTYNCVGGVIVSVLATSVIDRAFKSRSNLAAEP